MIMQIIIKELRQNLLSLRFSISTVLVVSLFAISGFLFMGEYTQQYRDYHKHVPENSSRLKQSTDHLYNLVMHEQKITKAPQALGFCVNGYEDALPNQFRFDSLAVHLPEVKNANNAFLPHFSVVDWVFIVSTITSFVALLMSYDCICGEKQAGTLRLMLCGALSRHTVLLGKYLGIMLSLGVSLLLGLMINLLIVSTAPEVQLSVLQWSRIGTLIVLSMIYVSVFVWLGLFVSCLVHLENHSMLILLLVWIGLVFLVPSFGRIAADISSPAPTQTERDRELAISLKDVENESRAGKFGDNAGSWGSQNDNPPAAARYYQARVKATNRILDKHFNQMVDQVATGRRITAVSPRVSYQRVAESIAGVGVHQVTHLYRQIKDYQEALQDFIIRQDAQDPESLHLFFQFPSPRVAANWKAISQRSVDFDLVPKFQERRLALGQSLTLVIWDMGALVLLNIVLFAAVFITFLKYDVR